MGSLAGAVIFLADDDADSLDLLSYLIDKEGATVRSATSYEALEILLTCTPDVLLLGLALPEVDGFELLARIRGITRLHRVPAVAVTAHAYARDRARCLEAGFAEHVPKPYEPERVLRLIADLLATKGAATSVVPGSGRS